MKYSIGIQSETGTENVQCNLSKKEAIAAAKVEAKKNPESNVYISWFRSADSQVGYLNPNGDHAITGKPW